MQVEVTVGGNVLVVHVVLLVVGLVVGLGVVLVVKVVLLVVGLAVVLASLGSPNLIYLEREKDLLWVCWAKAQLGGGKC